MSTTNENLVQLALPKSLLDTDLYKFTMQQAVLTHFPNARSTYRFTHRDKDVFFTKECYDCFISAIPYFAGLGVSLQQLNWLKSKCAFLKPEYIEYLSSFRFKPEQVKVDFTPSRHDPCKGRIEITATGPWVEAILWEVPLMACLSELYFLTVDRDWSYEGQEDEAYNKGVSLLQAGCSFSEFGTRRRRSYRIQDLVVGTLIRAHKDHPGTGRLVGTSNVHLAHTHGITPIGTIAHEWFMGVAALRGYEDANGVALDLWESVYPNGPLIALTDTFSTEAFFKDFSRDKDRALRWSGLRQDSGDPLEFAPRARDLYESMGINFREKSIIYSDSLDLDKALKIKAQCDELGFNCSFGIGTFLTNDFRSASSGYQEKSKALNMVIKLASIDDRPCIKISDDLLKNTGDADTVVMVKKLYGLPTGIIR